MAFETSPQEPVAALDAASSWPGGPNGPNSSELKQRIWFTLGALIIYRLGTYIPIPGIDAAILAQVFAQQQGGVLGIFDVFAGGALGRMTIFALNIMPYISAVIVMLLLTAVSPKLEQLKREGEAGRKKINQYTRYGTIFLAATQAYGISVGLEGIQGSVGLSPVFDPGMFFRFTTVVTLTGGTIFLMWLGEQITQRGVGNGISLIIFSGIVANLPLALVQVVELSRTGQMSTFVLLGLLIISVAVITGTVFFERARHRIVVNYPKRQVSNKMFGGETSHLPMKLNHSGVIPPIFASALLLTPLTVAGFSPGQGPEWLTWVTALLGPGEPLYLATYISVIVFFCFFYTSIVFNPYATAESLKKVGGFVPGYRPGKTTGNYLNFVLMRLTVLGAICLSVACLLPEPLISRFAVPFYFGGTSLLILVIVTMDTMGQINSYTTATKNRGNSSELS